MSELLDRLLTLQSFQTELDQLAVRRTKLPEQEASDTASRAVSEWQRRTDSIRARMVELEVEIASDENRNAANEADKTRLEGQLKTVIAPREAEALMHEIETVTARRDELDLAEIEALEEQSTLDDDLTTHLPDEALLRQASADADETLRVAVEDLLCDLVHGAPRSPAPPPTVLPCH